VEGGHSCPVPRGEVASSFLMTVFREWGRQAPASLRLQMSARGHDKSGVEPAEIPWMSRSHTLGEAEKVNVDQLVEWTAVK